MNYDYGIIDDKLVLPLSVHTLVGLHRTGKREYLTPKKTLFYPGYYDHLNVRPIEDFDSPLCPQWPIYNPDKKVIFTDQEKLKEKIEDTLGGGSFDQSLYTPYYHRKVAFSNIHPVIFSYKPSNYLNFELSRDTIESYIARGGWIIIIGNYEDEFVSRLNGYYLDDFICDRSQWQCAVKSFWDKG